jgi:hypothetical protein
MEEIDYYRSVSGLSDTKLSLDDYKYAYFKSVSGLAAGLSLNDYARAFYEAETGYANFEDGERAYYAIQLGIPDSRLAVDDLRQMFLDSQ